MKTKMFFLFTFVVSLIASRWAFAQDLFIGTFNINAVSNCAGLYVDQSNPDYAKANPYFGNYIPPGPIFINAAPGEYRFVTVSGLGCSIWSGDASGGTWHSTVSGSGGSTNIQHVAGQLVLYFWDWYPWDNDPNQNTTVSVYKIVPPSLTLLMYAGITITGNVGSTYELQYTTDINTTNWQHLADVTLATTSYLYFDKDSAGAAKRFYRAMLKP